jgi:hypothetical protein
MAVDSRLTPGKHRNYQGMHNEGWIDIQLADNGEARYRITFAGEAALKAKNCVRSLAGEPIEINMLTEFDQNTIANMTAALDYVCKKIPADRDSTELRKRIADELIQCATAGFASRSRQLALSFENIAASQAQDSTQQSVSSTCN